VAIVACFLQLPLIFFGLTGVVGCLPRGLASVGVFFLAFPFPDLFLPATTGVAYNEGLESAGALDLVGYPPPPDNLSR